MVTHGDDLTILGHDKNLDWFRETVQETLEVKPRGRFGSRTIHDETIRILNRVVEWNEEGIQYEAEQGHAEFIIRVLQLQNTSFEVAEGEVHQWESRELEMTKPDIHPNHWGQRNQLYREHR